MVKNPGVKVETFQLTTSQGGRQLPAILIMVPILFQLTTSQGGRRFVPRYFEDDLRFQLTTSQGGRHCLRRAARS